jgi:DNA invertase Pin-like site-specific DNA recombinase
MVPQNNALKIRAEHLQKLALVYVRQSTQYGVDHNIVGGRRQREEGEALALRYGWPRDKIIIVDCDQAVSGSSTDKRYGYVEMLRAIAEGEVGAVFSLESSRLSRDSADWHYLIKACDLNGTLIIDPDGVYDASDSNDSTLMKFKAIITEVELRWITQRLLGARRELARKGDLRFFIPIGFVYDDYGKLALDPDQVVGDAVRLLFSCFERIGTALGVARYFRQNNLKFPTLVRGGPRAGEYDWVFLNASRVGCILRNPMYAGVYVWGRSKTKKKLVEAPGGMPRVKKYQVKLPREDWQFVIYDHHPAYITWVQFLENQERISHNRSLPSEKTRGAARAGSALLQGIALCGKCGFRMSIYYSSGRPGAYYDCRAHLVHFGGEKCQMIPGESIDAALARLFLKAVAPAQIKLSLSACKSVDDQTRLEELQFEARLNRANIAVSRAKERLLYIDYTNRSALNCAQEDLKKSEDELGRIKLDQIDTHRNQIPKLGPKELELVKALTQELPRIWAAPTTDFVTKKKLIRCLINDVTLTRNESKVRVAIRWKTLACTEIDVELPVPGARLRTRVEIIELIKKLAPDHSNQEIADALNEAGIRNGSGGTFTKKRVKRLRDRYRIRLNDLAWPKPLESGCYGVSALAELLDVHKNTILSWIGKGRLNATHNDSRRDWEIALRPGELEKLAIARRSIASYPSRILSGGLAGYQSGPRAIEAGQAPTEGAV